MIFCGDTLDEVIASTTTSAMGLCPRFFQVVKRALPKWPWSDDQIRDAIQKTIDNDEISSKDSPNGIPTLTNPGE